MAKLARRKLAPVYAERVYDTVSRATPTALERVLYAKVGRTFLHAKYIYTCWLPTSLAVLSEHGACTAVYCI
jgi:hypothetical protein